MKKTDNLVGEVRFGSGAIMLTDPCYIPRENGGVVMIHDAGHEPFQAVIESADTGQFGVRVENLLLLRENGRKTREERAGEVWVDSGQMSAVDPGDALYFDNPDGPLGIGASFSQACAEARGEFSYLGACDLTLHSPDQGGVLDGRMFVTSTGYGDGSYPVYVGRDKTGMVRSVRVAFLEGDEDEKLDTLLDEDAEDDS